MFQRISIILLISLLLVQTALAQSAEVYNLTIEGQVTNANTGVPKAFVNVSLKTNQGEQMTVQADGTGHFTMIGVVRGDSGQLFVKSAFAENVVFGQMSLSWSAGGYGDKHLAADLVVGNDGEMTVKDGGTEAPLPNEPATGGPTLPTVTPSIAQTNTPPSSTPPGAATPEPAEEETGGGNGLVIVLGVIGLLMGVALIGGGVWWLKKGKQDGSSR